MANKGVRLFPAILVNYVVCVFIGVLFTLSGSNNFQWSASLFTWTGLSGLSFITMFNLMALLTAVYGLGTASVVSRMSMVIPLLFFFLYSNSSLTIINWFGVALGVVAVFFSNNVKNNNGSLSSFKKWLPFIVFLGYGVVDILLKFTSQTSQGTNFHLPTTLSFASAFVLGAIFYFFQKQRIGLKELKNGLVLGLLNYAAIYFFLIALETTTYSTALIFPLNGILILVLVNLTGLLFKEMFSKKRIISLIAALIAIILLT